MRIVVKLLYLLSFILYVFVFYRSPLRATYNRFSHEMMENLTPSNVSIPLPQGGGGKGVGLLPAPEVKHFFPVESSFQMIIDVDRTHSHWCSGVEKVASL